MKRSRERNITYRGEESLILEGYSDSDWAGDKNSRKSTFSFIFMVNSGPVSWCSKRQSTVTLSSTEAEYITVTLAAKKTTWIKLLLTELDLLQSDQQYTLIKISEHNICARTITNNIAQSGEQSMVASLSHRPEQSEDLKLRLEDPTIVVPVKRDN